MPRIRKRGEIHASGKTWETTFFPGISLPLDTSRDRATKRPDTPAQQLSSSAGTLGKIDRKMPLFGVSHFLVGVSHFLVWNEGIFSQK